ncbi:MAG: hypothetical protein PHP89_06670, partial [Candidatus Omnitrophica bacterium]|nr:hypothetical protein [Candidatus Omnitrophota bacterium]
SLKANEDAALNMVLSKQANNPLLANIYESLSKQYKELSGALRMFFNFYRRQDIQVTRVEGITAKQMTEEQKKEEEKLRLEETKIRVEINYLEQKKALLIEIEKLEYQRKKAKNAEEIKVIGLKIRLNRANLERIDAERAALTDTDLQQAIVKAREGSLISTDLDKIFAYLANNPVAYKNDLVELRRIYLTIREIEQALKVIETEQVEKNPAVAEKDNQKIARTLVEKLIRNLGLAITVPEEALQNYEALSSWLQENVFINRMQQSDIYEVITIILLPGIYNQQAKLDLKDAAPMQPVKISITEELDKVSIPNKNNASVSSLTITAGFDNDQISGGINFGGQIKEFFEDLGRLFSGRKDVPLEDLLRLQNKFEAIMKQALQDKQVIRYRVLAAIKDYNQSAREMGEKPFAYLQAKRNLELAQENHRKHFGYAVKLDITDEEARAVMMQDFENIWKASLDYLKQNGGKYGIKEEKLKDFFSSLFFNIGLNLTDGNFTIGFMASAVLWDSARGLDNIRIKIKGREFTAQLKEQKEELENAKKYFQGVYEDTNIPTLKRYEAFYGMITAEQRLRVLAELNPQKIIELLNSSDKKKGQAKQEKPQPRAEVYAQDVSIVTKEKIMQRMENIGKEEKPEFTLYSVNKDMEIKEILDRARSNQPELSGSVERSDTFGKELWEAVRDNTRESKPQEIINTAMFLAEKTNVSLTDINDYLERKLKDTVKKEELQKVQDKLVGLRINYVRFRQAVLLTEEVKIANQIKLAEGEENKKNDLESRSAYMKAEIAKNEKELASIKQLLIANTERAIAQKEAELQEKKDADAAKVKQEIESLKEEKERLEQILSSAEKLDQTQKKAQAEFDKEANSLFGPDKKFDGLMARLNDPKTITLEREQIRVYLVAKIADLSKISIILNEQTIQGKSLKAWADEVESLYKQAENIRQEKASAYRQEKDRLGIWMLTGKEPKANSRDNAKKEKAAVPTPDELLNHFEKNKDYLEPDEREREQKSLMFISKVYQRQGIMDWQELLKTSPPEVEAYLVKTKASETEQLKALNSVLSVVSPSKNTQVKASIFNLAFGILEYFKSKEAKSEVYQQFMRNYFNTMSILAGDIFSVAGQEEMGLSDKEQAALKEIKSILNKDGAISKLPYNLIQIQKAIEQAVKDKNEKAFIGLLALRDKYLRAYTQSLLEAEFTYLSFLRTNTKDTRFSISTNLVVSVILLFSNLLSNVLPDQDHENRKVKAAENILKIMDSQVRKIEEHKRPGDDVELAQSGKVLIRVALNDKGQTVYKYVTPEQYYDQTLRQNRIYEDKDTIISV